MRCSLPAEARKRAFFNGWVRKEAFVKALGEGLGHPFTGFAVSLTPGEPARMLSIGGNRAAAAAWMLCELSNDPAYVSALAVEGARLQVSCRPWRFAF